MGTTLSRQPHTGWPNQTNQLAADKGTEHNMEQYSSGHLPWNGKRWASIVTWPESVSTGRTPNESRDLHYSEGAARAVCEGIERDGLGGERKIFPIATRVEEVSAVQSDTSKETE
jgi:hypothetical protein